MYFELEDHVPVKIGGSGQGDEITAFIPPPGIVYDWFTGKLVSTPIYTRSDNAEEQYWERPIDLTYNFDRAFEVEKQKQKLNPYYVDQQLEAFIEQEWFRRVNGFWFMNKGEPQFITGTNYFYLTWWYLDGRYPSFRIKDAEYFYLWQYVQEDEEAFGLVEAAMRRSGKTVRATASIFDRVSWIFDAFAGIQSKTAPDAKKVFAKMINSFRSLPFFFRPVYDTSSGTRPKATLSFLKKSSNDFVGLEDELRGGIDFGSAENLFYDGQRLVAYLRDESGKTTTANIFDGWSIVKPCLLEGTKDIIGKAIYTTTIEEGGSAPFKLLWNDSDPKVRDPNTGRTRSGMYRIFTPAHKNDSSFIDKHGYCDEQASLDRIMQEREALSGNPRALAQYKRKYPLTIQEAFFSINEDSIYDSLKLNRVLEALSLKDEKYWFIRGNLHWKNGNIGDPVVFRENFNGRWNIHRKYLEAINKERSITNRFDKLNTTYRLKTPTIGVTGADTFDHSLKNIVDRGQASNAAFYTFLRSDPYLSDELDDTFVMEYVFRQASADLMAEDLLMQCLFTGTPAVIENAKPGAISYFERMGFSSLILKIDGKQGISASPKNKQQLAETTEIYINDSCHKVVFPRLLLDWNEFSLEDSTAFDSGMAAGWALLIAYRLDKKYVKTPKHRKQKEWKGSSSKGNFWSRHL